jgi:hypothetical protein
MVTHWQFYIDADPGTKLFKNNVSSTKNVSVEDPAQFKT